jgi:hypothetical protein
MSTTITIYSQRMVSEESLKDFVLSFKNGDWLEHGTMNGKVIASGVISKECGETIWVYHDGDDFEEAFDEEDFGKIVDALGARPKSSISLRVSHTSGSGKLALWFAERLIEKWGGIIDIDINIDLAGTSREMLEDR